MYFLHAILFSGILSLVRYENTFIIQDGQSDKIVYIKVDPATFGQIPDIRLIICARYFGY